MSLDTEDYAWLAKDAYQNRPHDVERNPISIHGHQYEVIGYAATPSGFHATAYRQVGTNDIVIAYRGTDLNIKHHPLTTIQDVATDAIMVADKANAQATDARKFAQAVLDYAKQHDITRDHVTVTGHSLGGTLAEIAASQCHLHGQTFNAYGAADLGLGIPEGGNQVINNVLAGDVVSAGHHFGQMVPYATTADIDSLRRAGYLDGQHGIPEALHAMRLSDHGGDNFAPDPGQGASVLTAENQARARAYAAPIARYREDVQHARDGLHLATELPLTPLWSAARTAEAVEGVTSLGQAALPAVEQAAHAVEHAAVYTGKAVEHAAEHAGAAIEQAASSARQEGAALLHRAEGLLHRTSLDESTHPAHALYQSARAGVHRMETERGIPHGDHSERLAGALTVAALQQGMARIDQVHLSDNGERAFGVQGIAPLIDFNRMAVVETATAVRNPFTQSSAQAEAAYPAWQQQQAQQRQIEQASSMATPEQHHAQGFSR